jgi:flagellar protein FliO/FliZ
MEFAGVNILKFLLALVFVLGLIGAFAVLARKMGFGHRAPTRRGAARRLEIVDSLPLDPKRRLMLVRRDDVEHLVLLGGSSETVVETGIHRDADAPDTSGAGGETTASEPRLSLAAWRSARK